MFVERKTQRFLDSLRVADRPKIHELTPGDARRVWVATQAVDVPGRRPISKTSRSPVGPPARVPPHRTPRTSGVRGPLCCTSTEGVGCLATGTPTTA